MYTDGSVESSVDNGVDSGVDSSVDRGVDRQRYRQTEVKTGVDSIQQQVNGWPWDRRERLPCVLSLIDTEYQLTPESAVSNPVVFHR